MRLGIEEDLRSAHAVRVGPLEVGGHEVVEVILGHEHRGALVIDVEEGLQVAELVGRPDCVDRRVPELDAVAQRQLEHHLGLERPLDVDVQLCLR
jgi:hypothetical protein